MSVPPPVCGNIFRNFLRLYLVFVTASIINCSCYHVMTSKYSFMIFCSHVAFLCDTSNFYMCIRKNLKIACEKWEKPMTHEDTIEC